MYRHCERSEAISSLKARLLRCARKDEVYGLGAAALWQKTRKDEVHGLRAVFATTQETQGHRPHEG